MRRARARPSRLAASRSRSSSSVRAYCTLPWTVCGLPHAFAFYVAETTNKLDKMQNAAPALQPCPLGRRQQYAADYCFQPQTCPERARGRYSSHNMPQHLVGGGTAAAGPAAPSGAQACCSRTPYRFVKFISDFQLEVQGVCSASSSDCLSD